VADPSTLPSAGVMSRQPVYTVEEARALLPQVRATLLQLAIERRRSDEAHDAFHHGMAEDAPRGGRVAGLEARMAAIDDGIRDLLAHLESLGIVVRDLDTGLVDFPTLRDGEPAWLCWRIADPDLAFWHTTREGFASRRPL
jgi:hypothetical protein